MKKRYRYAILGLLLVFTIILSFKPSILKDVSYYFYWSANYFDINSGMTKSETYILIIPIKSVIKETPFSEEIKRLGIEIPEEHIWKRISATEQNSRDGTVTFYSTILSDSKMLIVILDACNAPENVRIDILKEVLQIYKTANRDYRNDRKIHEITDKVMDEYW